MAQPEKYAEPLAQLFKFGMPKLTAPAKWRDYVGKLGLESRHIPELIEIAVTWPEVEFESDEEAGNWAPVHAWRALGQLKAVEAVEPLLRIMDPLDDIEDEWYEEEFPDVFGMIGPAAIPQLAKYFADQENFSIPRNVAANGLTEIAKKYPDTREEILPTFREVFSHYEENDEDFNAYIICDLLEMKAVDMAEMIRDAYAAGRVDEFCVSWEDVEEALGPLSIEPPPESETMNSLLPADFLNLLFSNPPSFLGNAPKKKKQPPKKKAKKKSQTKAKKQNRKKK